MTGEGAEFLTELREFRDENDHLLAAVRTELTGLRTDLDAAFRQMDAGFGRLNGQFAVLLEKIEALRRQVTDTSSLLEGRRTLG